MRSRWGCFYMKNNTRGKRNKDSATKHGLKSVTANERGTILLECLLALSCAAIVLVGTLPIWQFLQRTQRVDGLAIVQTVTPLLAQDFAAADVVYVQPQQLTLETKNEAQQLLSRVVYVVGKDQLIRKKNGGFERVATQVQRIEFVQREQCVGVLFVIDREQYSWCFRNPEKK